MSADSRTITAGPHHIELTVFGASPSAPAGHWAITCWACKTGRVMDPTAAATVVPEWADAHGVGAVNLRRDLDELLILAGLAEDARRIEEGRLF